MALGTGETWDDATGRGRGGEAGSSLLPSIFVLRFFGSGCAGSGRGVAEARTGQDIAKKKQRPLTWRGEGDALGGMASGTGETREDATGRGWGGDAGSSSSPLIFVPRFFGSGCARRGRGGSRSQDWSGHRKKKQRPLTWRGEGDASGGVSSGTGEMREDATGWNLERKRDCKTNKKIK